MVKLFIPKAAHKYTGAKDKDRQPHGKGRLVGSNGDIYEGFFEHGAFHGYGEYLFGEAGSYKGEFRNNLFNGNGVEKYADAQSYVGEFADGLRHGVKNGATIVRIRITINHCYRHVPTPHHAISVFYETLATGTGRMNYSNGAWYFGAWELGKRQGKGLLVNKKAGLRYQGGWQLGLQHGAGVLHRKYGTGGIPEKVTGTWSEGKLVNRNNVTCVSAELQISEAEVDDQRVIVETRHQERVLQDLASKAELSEIADELDQ